MGQTMGDSEGLLAVSACLLSKQAVFQFLASAKSARSEVVYFYSPCRQTIKYGPTAEMAESRKVEATRQDCGDRACLGPGFSSAEMTPAHGDL